jgi:hypothetical protein
MEWHHSNFDDSNDGIVEAKKPTLLDELEST